MVTRDNGKISFLPEHMKLQVTGEIKIDARVELNKGDELNEKLAMIAGVLAQQGINFDTSKLQWKTIDERKSTKEKKG